MKQIKIHSWKAKTPDNKEVEENTISLFSVMLSSKKPEELPKGLDKFRLFSRLSSAFDKAEKDKLLILEESDYTYLLKLLESDLLSTWGMNKDIVKAVDLFMDAKEFNGG